MFALAQNYISSINLIHLLAINLIYLADYASCHYILDLHLGLVGGKVQKNILSILLLAPAVVGDQHIVW